MNDFALPFKSDLAVTSQDVANKNTLNSFLSIRTKGNDFESDIVVGMVLSALLRKKIEGYSYDDFRNDCKGRFETKLDDARFWSVLDKMYFETEALFNISPETLLFKGQKSHSNNKTNDRFASLYISLLQELRIKEFDTKLNFLEHEILSTLNERMREAKEAAYTAKEKPYLPFLSQSFRQDLQFLSQHPKYLLSQIKPFLNIYGFVYVSQLALSLTDWRRCGEPTHKPLYFIMDHEKASQERAHVRNHGYKLFERSCYRLFPYLSMLEMLQPDANSLEKEKKIPLWELASRIERNKNQTTRERLEFFAKAFKSNRNLSNVLPDSGDALDWLEQILGLAIAQFEDTSTERPAINKKYVGEVEKYLASDFVQRRGRAGRVLVLNQDHLLLLANIAIGDRDKLRFQELIAEFRKRGIYLDKQTEIELIKFFERIGNVEKMSDSGDAVYVRKTI
ncbi:DNA phosphorothioation-dependent restriction protein DptG [Vibrio sp. CDRSL-10 TSBA]